MSKNIQQVFVANPITSNTSTDLMYFGQSPYGLTNDAAMTYANFSAQFGAPYTAAALTKTDDTNVTLTLGGTPATALLHATSLTLGWTGTLSGTRGGTGVNNGANTATYAGNLSFANSFTTSGNFAVTQTYTGITNVTFPTSGTLATTSQIPSFPLSLANGGTNANLTASNGGIFYSTASAGAILSGTATANQVLLSGSSTTPAWSTATYPATTTVSQILYSSSANTIGGITTANSAVLVTNSTGVPAYSGTMTNGQLIIGSTTATPTAATLTPGTGVSITNGAGSITIASTGVGSLVWNDLSGTTQTAVVNNGYIISNASQTTVTIPATVAEGSVIGVAGKGAAGWILAANTGQTIHFGSSATSSGGSLTSTNQWDNVIVLCVTANTTFTVIQVQGILTVA
jgi:hypothetical protein